MLRVCVCSGLRRLPLTPWESNVVNRLQQPTHSYLARSRSAMSLSGEQTGNVHTSHMKDPAWLLQSVTSETGFFFLFSSAYKTAHSATSVYAVYILVS